MRLTYGNIVKGLYLLLLSVSSIASLINYHTNAVAVAAISLVGFIAFDTICYLRDKNPPMKDLAPELKELKDAIAKVHAELNEVKNDHSIAHLASTFKRK